MIAGHPSTRYGVVGASEPDWRTLVGDRDKWADLVDSYTRKDESSEEESYTAPHT